MPKKQYDLIIYAASSFVGQLLCRYIDEQFNHPQQECFSWAIAGRNFTKLSQLSESLTYQPVVLKADTADQQALTDLCQQSKLICTTAGPYALYGEPLLKACVETGTDYCDLCGELPWLKAMIDKYHEQAQQSGARIIPCCGFDSIPSDLGVYYTQKIALETFGNHCQKISMRVRALRGSASGGTIASMVNIAKEAANEPKKRRLLANPYALCQKKLKGSPKLQTQTKFDATFMRWTSPFIMASINTPVVLRSNELLGHPYGQDFSYDEAILAGKGWKGWLRASGLTATLRSFFLASSIKASRQLLEKHLLPKPGIGPSPLSQQSGFFDMRFCGFDESSAQSIRIKLTGQGDPGYASTSKMLGQVCGSVILDFYKKGKKTGPAGGFWTPSSFFGDILIKRLESAADIKFEIMS